LAALPVIVERGIIIREFAAKIARKRLRYLMECPQGPEPDASGYKYTGFHAIRHFYASWCINRREDGGLALPPKMVQERLGHSSITLTMDTYGHLFPRNDDGEELAAAEQALLS
ncbi:MAG: hypothetical protein AAAC48_26990, partial [Phyllobacterium sp.]